MNHTTKKITYTAMFISILVLFQFLSASMGQFITGSLVNLVLIASVIIGGFSIGIIVAAISPLFAFILGIGPAFIQMIPVIMIGNMILVIAYGLIVKDIHKKLFWVLALVTGALLKFSALYLGIVKIALPLIPNMKEKQIAVISASFSWPQLVTALIGGILAFIILPYIMKITKKGD